MYTRKMVLNSLAALVIVTCGFCIPAMGQEASVTPGSNGAFLHGSSEALIKTLKLRPPNPNDSKEQQVIKIADAMAATNGFSTSVWVCNGCGFSSHPKLGIIVDLDQLERIKNQSQVQQFAALLTFLMAHEEAHQVQFRQYSSSIVDLPEQDREVYEAQADLLGGAYLLGTMTNFSQEDRDATLQTLEVAHNIGVEQYALADHPSQIARLTAVRFGMAYETMTNLQKLGSGPPEESAAILIKKIDVRPGENAMSWSLRVARYIVSYRRPDIANLVLDKAQIDWDTEASNPVVHYQLTYENLGPSSIDVELEVRCDAVPRDDYHDVLHSQLIDARTYSFSLSPQASKTLTDTLQWAGATNPALMPRLIFAPDPAALIEVKYPNGSAPVATPGQNAVLQLDDSTTPGGNQNLGTVIETILNRFSDDVGALRAGPGRKEGSEVEYPVDPQIPNSQSTTLWMPGGGDSEGPHLSARFIETSQEITAAKIYQDEVSSIRSVLQKVGTWDERAIHGGQDVSTSFGQGKFVVSVTDDLIDGTYEVSVDMSADRDADQ